MARRSLFAIAAAATLVLVACSEREPGDATGPQFAPASAGPCGFSNSLVNGYFPSSRQSYMLSVKSSMANASQASAKRTFGFQMMDSIGSVSRNTAFSISPTAGAQLTVAIIACIFPDNSFSYPPRVDSITAFSNALTNSTGGAYYVRGGGTGTTDPSGRGETVLGRTNPPGGTEGNLSGIAPLSGSWTSMLPGSGIERRALIYGYPVGSSPLVFEWATVPSELTFSTPAVIAVCDNNTISTAMVHEEDVGVLAYVNSSICNTPQSMTMIEGWGPKALAARLGRMLANTFTPEPVQAMAVLTGTGGKTSTVPKSEFGNLSVTSLEVSWKNDPVDPSQGGSTWYGTTSKSKRPVSVNVSAVIPDGTSESKEAAIRFCAYLTSSNNNGTPTKLQTDLASPRSSECTNPPGADTTALSVLTTATSDPETSLADFGNVYVTKAGNVAITATISGGRAATGVISSQANIKPAQK